MLEQRLTCSYEVLVIDNGSSDETVPQLRALRDPRVRLFPLGVNLYSAARNVGIEHADAPLTVMLDDDSVPQRLAVERAARELERHERLGVVAGRIKLPNQGGRDETAGGPHVFIGCGAVFRTDQLRALGGFPTDLGYYGEEYEVSARYLNAGLAVRSYANIMFEHFHDPGARNRGRQLGMLARNNITYFTRWLSEQRSGKVAKWVTARYALIADASGVASEVAAYIDQGWRKREQMVHDGDIARAQHAAVREAIAPHETLLSPLKRLLAQEREPPWLYGLTREAGFFLEAFSELGVSPKGIVADGLAAQQKRFLGAAVCTAGDVGANAWGLVPSTAPGCADFWNMQAKAQGHRCMTLTSWSNQPLAAG